MFAFRRLVPLFAALPIGSVAAAPALLPLPASIVEQAGSFRVGGATIAARGPGASAAAQRLVELVGRSRGTRMALATNGKIQFVRDASVAGAEGYKLVVRPDGVTVSASTDTGLFYGATTLWQLIQGAGSQGTIPAMTVTDAPAFAWRGVMLDSVRHFQPVGFIKGLIDRMALDKLNVLQWHLTDDQGWRVPIDRYPRLIDIGAWRQEAGAAGYDAAGKPTRYGGFYTKAEIRGVVAYAAARHITIVPEIEMPGHATAAIAAYPELGSASPPPSQPSNAWGVLPNLFNTDDATFTFLENVLDEVIALFPSRYIHVGGDEATKEQWAANPRIQAKRASLGLASDDKLQGWFTARIGAYLEKHGRRLIGWDEILLGDVPQTATIMSWRGMEGAISAAKAGHDAVLSPAPDLYLDNRQSDSADEPPGRGAIVDWKRLYAFQVAPPALTENERKHLLGLQVNEWTEHARTTNYAERMIWPRAAILAELGWSQPASRDWTSFAPRLAAELGRYDALKLGYDATPLVPQADISGAPGAIKVSLRQQAGIGTIRYTTDGSTPTATSPAYEAPLAAAGSIMAQAFLGTQPLGAAKRFAIGSASLFSREGAQLELCGNKLPLRLEDDGPANGPRAIHWVDILQPCWRWRRAPLDGVQTITAVVGSVPFNFAVGDAVKRIRFRKPETPAGDMEIRQDECHGPVIARLPLGPAVEDSGVTRLSGPIRAAKGLHDLCITFTQDKVEPLWVVDKLTLAPAQ